MGWNFHMIKTGWDRMDPIHKIQLIVRGTMISVALDGVTVLEFDHNMNARQCKTEDQLQLYMGDRVVVRNIDIESVHCPKGRTPVVINPEGFKCADSNSAIVLKMARHMALAAQKHIYD